MMSIEIFIVLIVISVIVAALISRAIIRELQTQSCPYCSCREYCNNGVGAEPACDTEDARPFVCMEGLR